MGRIDIEIASTADNSALEETNAQLDELESQSGGAEGASDELGGSLSGLNGVLGALGITISAGAVLALAVQLNEAGAAALRVHQAFDVFTGGKSDEYITKVQAATRGLIDDEDALVASQSLLNYGLVQNADQAAEMIRNATILGAQFSQIGAKQAADDFALLLNTLSPRQMKEFGLGIDEVTAKTHELMRANSDLSDREATRQAVLELSAQKAGKFTSILNDQESALDRAKLKWEDFWEGVGMGINKDIATPIMNAVEATDALSQKATANRDAMLQSSDSLDDYIGALEASNNGIELQGAALAAAAKEWRNYQTAQQDARTASLDNLEAMRLHRDEGIAPTTAQLEEEAKAQEKATQAAEDYKKALNEQAGLQLNILKNIGDLTTAQGGMAGVFDTANQLIGGLNLSQTEQLSLYEQVGIATGQVTQQQILQANGMRDLLGLLANGAINGRDFAGALQDIKSGGDAAHIAITTLQKSVEDTAVAAGKSGDDFDKFVTSHLNAATKEASNTSSELTHIQEEAVKVGKLETKVKIDRTEVDQTALAVGSLSSALESIPKDITVMVHLVTAGDAAGLVNAANAGPSTP